MESYPDAVQIEEAWSIETSAKYVFEPPVELPADVAEALAANGLLTVFAAHVAYNVDQNPLYASYHRGELNWIAEAVEGDKESLAASLTAYGNDTVKVMVKTLDHRHPPYF
jgi:hypothetical protein